MSSFSETMSSTARAKYSVEHLARLDQICAKQTRLADEEALFAFLNQLEPDLLPDKEAIEVYLRHRDIIAYTTLTEMQVSLFCFSIKDFMPRREYRKLENFLSGKYNTLNVKALLASFVKLLSKHPQLSLPCFSLLKQIENLIEDETPPEPVARPVSA